MDEAAALVAPYGLSVNQQGRAFRNGAALALDQKVATAVEYLRAKTAANGARPNITALSERCKVSRATILKIEEEIQTHGKVLDPKDIISNKAIPTGPGSKSLSDLDVFVILMLYHEEPSRTLRSYAVGLYLSTGTIVHESTISRFFLYGFDIKGSLCKPNMIPYDKLRPENLERALDYLLHLTKFHRSRVKFGDEKHMKGSDIWCRHTRRNVFTGVIPPMMTHSDFRNTYSIVGFCGIDERSTPLRYGISQGINNAANFSLQVQLAVLTGFLLPFDCLVLDRASIHIGGVNNDLADWLWDNFRIFLLLLPARTPEWNPIELVWNILTQRLKVFSLFLAKEMGQHSLVQAAQVIMDNITHEEVNGCFRKCGV